jgi:hypothetical protein
MGSASGHPRRALKAIRGSGVGIGGIAIFIENVDGKSSFDKVRIFDHFVRRVHNAACHASFLQPKKEFVSWEALSEKLNHVSSSLKDFAGQRVRV